MIGFPLVISARRKDSLNKTEHNNALLIILEGLFTRPQGSRDQAGTPIHLALGFSKPYP